MIYKIDTQEVDIQYNIIGGRYSCKYEGRLLLDDNIDRLLEKIRGRKIYMESLKNSDLFFEFILQSGEIIILNHYEYVKYWDEDWGLYFEDRIIPIREIERYGLQ